MPAFVYFVVEWYICKLYSSGLILLLLWNGIFVSYVVEVSF